MTISFIIGGGGADVTSAIDTTGSDLLIVGRTSSAGAETQTDSKSNTYTGLTVSVDNFEPIAARLHYVGGTPTVGSGHTFEAGLFFEYAIAAGFSGMHATPFDTENGGNTGGSANTTLSAGAVTPTASGNSCVVVTFISLPSDAGTITEPSGFTLIAKKEGGGAYNAGLAYKIQTIAGATETPVWNWTNSIKAAARVAVFQGAAGGGGGSAKLIGGKLTQGGILLGGRVR